MTSPLRSPVSRPRRTTAASAALLLGLALTACGGGDDGDDTDDDPSPRASDSTSQADSDSATSTAPDLPTSATEGAGLPTEADLEGALLTVDDVPAGFAVDPDEDDDDGDSPFDDTCLGDVGEFSDALGSEPAAKAEVELSTETATSQASVSSQVQVYADAAAVAPAFATFTDRLQTCTSVESSADGVDFAFDISYDDTVSVPGADDQLAFDVTGTISSGDQSYPAAFRYVVALSGPLLSLVGTTTIGEDSTGVVASTDALAEVQAGRVAELG